MSMYEVISLETGDSYEVEADLMNTNQGNGRIEFRVYTNWPQSHIVATFPSATCAVFLTMDRS